MNENTFLIRKVRVMRNGLGLHGLSSQLLRVMAALVWPFFMGLLDSLNFRKYRSGLGIVIFCAYAGWTVNPIKTSDGNYYIRLIETLKMGFSAPQTEPIPNLLIHLVAWLGVSWRAYFMILGLLFGVVVVTVARELFSSVPRDKPLNYVVLFFSVAFFLNQPVIEALNARYQLGMWVMVLATVYVLQQRYTSALLIAVAGSLIHYGHVLFTGALLLLVFSRALGRRQVTFAYLFLLFCILLPDSVFYSLGNLVQTFSAGTPLGQKVGMTLGYAEKRLQADGMAGGEPVAWFLQWFGVPVFYSLLATGQFLWVKIRTEPDSMLYQLWVLIILMWGLHFLASPEPEAAARMLRNTVMLLFLWNALWFLTKGPYSVPEVLPLLLLLPIVFYYVVAYRRWFAALQLETLMPSFFSFFPEYYLPKVLSFFGF